ncbi:MAG: PhoPQ-activated pathogenicity-related family protein [Acidobacteriota bacterium]
MKVKALVLLLLVVVLPACSDLPGGAADLRGLQASAPGRTPLDEYVRAPDPDFSYQLVNTLVGEDYLVHVVKMTSQQWRGAGEVDRTLWWHWLTLIEPTQVTHSVALLMIAGGANDEPPPLAPKPALVKIAVATGSIVAELRMVPNQPLSFVDDEAGPRREDELIAYAWDKYLKGGDATWLPRLPMTHSAVRAMDAVTDFFHDRVGRGLDIDGFVVAGASKRGWTTWTTAAADRRVVAIIPMVIDLLNVEESFSHHYAAYGFWAPAVHDYEETGIMRWLGSEQFHALLAIVDPYQYRARLTMPKFMINAAGDEFFLPDSSQFYFDDLPGEKLLRYIPNSGHSLEDTDAMDSLRAFYRAILEGTQLPHFTWTLENDGSIRVRTGATTPSQVLFWQATNEKVRDFRIDTIGETWSSTALHDQGDGLYKGSVEEPTVGWTAFFVELTYPTGGEVPLKLTTQVRVVPDRLPFKAPVGRRNGRLPDAVRRGGSWP